MAKTLREQFIDREKSGCKHFTGVQNKICKAGVSYESLITDETVIPCIPRIVKLNRRVPAKCELYQVATQEEAERIADEHIAAMERHGKAVKAASDDAKRNGFKKGHGGKGAIPCPVCEGGTLHYSVASYNGHLWGKCSTVNCVAWMQ